MVRDDQAYSDQRCAGCDLSYPDPAFDPNWVEYEEIRGRCTRALAKTQVIGTAGAGAIQLIIKGRCLLGNGHTGQCRHPVSSRPALRAAA